MQDLHHGQEIYLFFFKYGSNGIIGAIVSSLLIGSIIFLSCRLIKKYEIEDYYHFLDKINKTGSKIKFNKIISTIINMFLLISFYIMVAGFSAYISQELKVSALVGSILISSLAYITFKYNIEGIIKINTILIPIIIILIILFGIITINKTSNIKNLNISEDGKWIISSVLYGSYNSILLIPILITLKKYIKNNKQTILISAITISIIILLTISIFKILGSINIDISQIELPVIYMVSFMGKLYKILYGFIIISSIFTTAISSGYGFLTNCSKSQKKYKYLNLFICISGTLISGIGFSKLINFLYPLFGILGLMQIFFIIKSNFLLTIEKKM